MKSIWGLGIHIREGLKLKIPVVLATVVLCIGMLSASTSTVAAWSASANSSPDYAYIGDTVSYSMTIKNTGDTVLQLNGGTLTIDWGAVTTTKTMSGAVALEPNESGKLTCSFKVPEATPSIYTVSIEVEGKAVGDWFTETKEYIDTITIRPVPQLTVSVSSATTSGQAPFTANINVIPSGVSPYSYHWTFGDGSTSTSQSPSHTYQQGGTYTATCTVTDSKGQTASDSITFVVKGNPTDITDTSTGGGGSLGGFSPMLIIGAVAVIVAIIAVVAFVVMRRK